MTFKIETYQTKLDTWHINCRLKKKNLKKVFQTKKISEKKSKINFLVFSEFFFVWRKKLLKENEKKNSSKKIFQKKIIFFFEKKNKKKSFWKKKIYKKNFKNFQK